MGETSLDLHGSDRPLSRTSTAPLEPTMDSSIREATQVRPETFSSSLVVALAILFSSTAAAQPMALRSDGLQFPDGTVQTTAAAGGEMLPVHCSLGVVTANQETHLPFICTKPDGTSFESVPAGYYLYVTDFVVNPLLISATAVVLSIRWHKSDTGSPACSGGVVDLFNSSQVGNLSLINREAQAEPTKHYAFSTPFFVLHEGDCLGGFLHSDEGAEVRASGFLRDRLVTPF